MDEQMMDSNSPFMQFSGNQLPQPAIFTKEPLGNAQVNGLEMEWFAKTAEKAINFFNKTHQGSEIELVELVNGYSFFINNALWQHINFKAKPKNSRDGDQSLRPFFAELWYGPYGAPGCWLSEGEITACSLLQQGSTKDHCGFCPKNTVFHPLQGFKTGL